MLLLLPSSMIRLDIPKVPLTGLPDPLDNKDAAFFNFSCSAFYWAVPADPLLSLIFGPGVLANALATLVLVGAK